MSSTAACVALLVMTRDFQVEAQPITEYMSVHSVRDSTITFVSSVIRRARTVICMLMLKFKSFRIGKFQLAECSETGGQVSVFCYEQEENVAN